MTVSPICARTAAAALALALLAACGGGTGEAPLQRPGTVQDEDRQEEGEEQQDEGEDEDEEG